MTLDVRALPLVAILAAPLLGESAPILHEYVPPEGARAGDADGAIGDEAGDGLLPGDGEPVLEAGAIAPLRPDRRTTRDGLLAYHEPFSPSVAPLKRGEARDAVRADYAIVVGDPRLRRVAPEPGDRAGETFTASLLVLFEPGRAVPIPSVAPAARLLAIASEPQSDVELLRDGADNEFLRATARGPHRVTLRLDAPASYFTALVYPGLTAEDVPKALRPSLPPGTREAAAVVLERLGVHATDPLDRTLARLVGAFRAFEPGPLDEPTGDAYLDIALGGRGVCRHRAFAFVVTVQALGLPARYVDNEAHAFAEVWLPRSGWARIDLGGDALRLVIMNASQKELHRTGPDPFPQPLGFSEGISRPRGGVDGAPLDATAPRPARMDDRPLPRVGSARAEPHAEMPALPSVTLHVDVMETSGVRGQPVVVEGGADAPGARVDVWLSPDGERRGLLVGSTFPDGSGRFRLAATVPRDAPVGRYQLVVTTPGDDAHGPARAE
ncbi:MAG: transglutaminase domain-containing protein [Myxococcota bacterium]